MDDEEDSGFTIPDGYEVVFRKTIIDSSGALLHAEDFGIEYFLLLVPMAEVPENDPSKWTL